MNDDIERLRTWIGRSRTSTDTASAAAVRRMAGSLGVEAAPADGDPLPPLWHQCLHLPIDPIGALGPDGHPARGGFFPPVQLPRRMWAAGRVDFVGDLCVGEEVTKVSTVTDVTEKAGRSGSLIFVEVTHELSVDGDTRLVETQDLVYRDTARPDRVKPEPVPQNPEWSRSIVPSEVWLFRYSAVTFNAHRIHYDREYARSVEGYRDLVVHGPLTATLLAGLAAESTGRDLAAFSFRATAPLYVDESFTIAGRPAGDGAELWAATADGALAMTARARFR